jgi:YfiH family protein
MENLKSNFSFIIPEAIEEKDGTVEAWFTLKNRAYKTPESNIEGLNLGINTSDNEKVIQKNRSELLSALNLDEEWVAYANQVHSNRVQVVNEGGTCSATDGLVTTVPGLTLAIQVADCAAVLLWDPVNYVVGAFHAGWRGAVAEIAPKGLQIMQQEGADLKALKAFISPCLSLENFEVGIEVADQFPEEFIDRDSFSKPHVNLKRFLVHQLNEIGMKTGQIEVREECTIDDADHFYSYRREGNKSGRMMALIRLKR